MKVLKKVVEGEEVNSLLDKDSTEVDTKADGGATPKVDATPGVTTNVSAEKGTPAETTSKEIPAELTKKEDAEIITKADGPKNVPMAESTKFVIFAGKPRAVLSESTDSYELLFEAKTGEVIKVNKSKVNGFYKSKIKEDVEDKKEIDKKEESKEDDEKMAKLRAMKKEEVDKDEKADDMEKDREVEKKEESIRVKEAILQYAIGRRDNPQFNKPYYNAYGRLSKSDITKKENAIYGSISITTYDTEESYRSAIDKLKELGFRVNMQESANKKVYTIAESVRIGNILLETGDKFYVLAEGEEDNTGEVKADDVMKQPSDEKDKDVANVSENEIDNKEEKELDKKEENSAMDKKMAALRAKKESKADDEKMAKLRAMKKESEEDMNKDKIQEFTDDEKIILDNLTHELYGKSINFKDITSQQQMEVFRLRNKKDKEDKVQEAVIYKGKTYIVKEDTKAPEDPEKEQADLAGIDDPVKGINEAEDICPDCGLDKKDCECKDKMKEKVYTLPESVAINGKIYKAGTKFKVL